MLIHSKRSLTLGLAFFMAAATLLTFATLAGLISNPVAAFGRVSQHSESVASVSNQSSSLADLALGKVLTDASPVFGDYQDLQSNTSTWSVRRVLCLT